MYPNIDFIIKTSQIAQCTVNDTKSIEPQDTSQNIELHKKLDNINKTCNTLQNDIVSLTGKIISLENYRSDLNDQIGNLMMDLVM